MLFSITEVLELINATYQQKLERSWNFGKPMFSFLMGNQFGSVLVPRDLYTRMPAALGMVVT